MKHTNKLLKGLRLFCMIVFVSGFEHSQAQSSNGATKDWTIGVQTWTFRVFTFEEVLKKADSAKVKSIEAFWGQPLGGGLADSFGVDMSAASRSMVKTWLESRSIRIVSMGVISPATREEWKRAFELAKEFNLSYITAEPRKNLLDMVDSMAAEYHLKVAIHDHPRPNPYWHPDSVLAAIKNHPNIGCCADLGHWARNGLDPVECLKKMKGHVLGVHLKDIKTFNDTKAEDAPVGTGVLNYPAIFAELARQDFHGPLFIEQESNIYHNLPDVIKTIEYSKTEISKLK